MKKLVLANQKGGVGKSAITCQFAYFMASQGKRVLVIDLDHQRNTSRPLSKNNRVVVAAFTSSHVLRGENGSLPQGPFVLVAGDDGLSLLVDQKDKHNAFVNNLNDFMAQAADAFDLCIVDTNPNPDIRYAAALCTADFVLSPIELNQEAIDGIGGLLNHPRYGYHKIKQTVNPTLQLIGLLPNQVEATPFQRSNFQQVAEAHAKLLILVDPAAQRFAFIPARTAIPEAQADGLYLADMKKTSARDAWRVIRPSFAAIAKRMNFEG